MYRGPPSTGFAERGSRGVGQREGKLIFQLSIWNIYFPNWQLYICCYGNFDNLSVHQYSWELTRYDRVAEFRWTVAIVYIFFVSTFYKRRILVTWRCYFSACLENVPNCITHVQIFYHSFDPCLVTFSSLLSSVFFSNSCWFSTVLTIFRYSWHQSASECIGVA